MSRSAPPDTPIPYVPNVEPYAIVFSNPSAEVFPWSWTSTSPSVMNTDTVLSSGLKPWSTWNGSHGLISSFSAMQWTNFRVVPIVSMSI